MEKFRLIPGDNHVEGIFLRYCKYYIENFGGSMAEDYFVILESFFVETGMGYEDNTFTDNKDYFVKLFKDSRNESYY